MKYRRENFKALKDELRNIKFDINGQMAHSNVLLNDKNEYIFRVQNRDSYFSRPTPEQKYLFNEILKHYELSINHLIQGFNNIYFDKLSDLMSIKKIRTNEYSKKRIELFNSRINENHKSYINYLKRKGNDADLRSTISRKYNPMNMTFTTQLRNKIFNIKERKNKIIQRNQIKDISSINPKSFTKLGLNSDFNISSFNQYKKSIHYKNENSLSTARDVDDSINSKNIIAQKIIINQSFPNKINKKNFKKSMPMFDLNNKNDINKNEDDIEIKEKKSKEEFFKTFNKKNYMKFLKFKYHFVEDQFSQEKEPKLSIKDIKRKNMFRFKPRNKFILKKAKDGDKIIFFKKIENDINRQNKSLIRIHKSKIWLKKPPNFNNKIINQSVN